MYHTIFILVLFVVLALALNRKPSHIGIAGRKTLKPILPFLESAIIKCKNETDLDDSMIYEDTKTLFKDPKGKCFVMCLKREYGQLNEDGTIAQHYIEMSQEYYPKEYIKALVSCRNQSAESFCETAVKSITCFMSNYES